MSGHWALEAAERIASQCIEHSNYRRAVDSVFNALSIAQPGEVVVVVGPSRVGKSRAVAQAVARSARPRDGCQEKPFVIVQAENASTLGAFSTKAFMQALCRAIEHPIYGMAEPDDPWGGRIHARLHRTSEAILRDAVEHGLLLLNTKYLVVDEAHHVGYAGSHGSNALAVLDSWKCLAHKTCTVLCLVGSYQLLDILANAPHLLGRQRLIEFPRYRITDPEDVFAFTQILQVWSSLLRFEDPSLSLRSWNRLLFVHSFGCIGHLSKWLRSSLGEAVACDLDSISEHLLRATRHPASQEAAITAEIEVGERAIAKCDMPLAKPPAGLVRPSTKKAFQRKTRRFDIGGRV